MAYALADYRQWVLPDDLERERAIAGSDDESLRALVDAVKPLLGEIDDILDQLSAQETLSEGDQNLEVDLHALAQAALEAEIELGERAASPGDGE